MGMTRRVTLDLLKKQLAALDLPGDTEVIIRADWEGDTPEGNCFLLRGVAADVAHDESGTQFVALECDQEEE